MAKHALSPAELDARQSNAEKSTGPRTPEGKQRARMNAVQHGAYSTQFRETMLALGEDTDAYDRLRLRLMGLFHEPGPDGPADPGPLLAFAVEELAELHWQLERERNSEYEVYAKTNMFRIRVTDLCPSELAAIDRTCQRQDQLSRAIDRKLRTILALVREASQQAKADREAGGEPAAGSLSDSLVAPTEAAPPEAVRGVGSRAAKSKAPGSSPAGATPEERIPDSGISDARPDAKNAGTKSHPRISHSRIPDPKPDSKPDSRSAGSKPARNEGRAKNEGTNRGSPVESTHGAAV